jgi:hypothetical protein
MNDSDRRFAGPFPLTRHPRTAWRGVVAFALASTMLASAASAAVCTRPAEKSAFDIAGLKSELMVTALACNEQDRYNSFISRYRSDLMQEDRALESYFGRSYGRRARSEHDNYITNLANVQSESGIKLGTGFCGQSVGMFDKVLALHSDKELPAFAASQTIAQPMDLAACPVPVRKPQPAKAKVIKAHAKPPAQKPATATP